ncbi:MAG: (2Fe-2S) ferredoxin domain-containing protein [Nitriliruptorales bacterium]|nr:(2Fe-2S) ferredoxin domain-containing protein [Nitriliruptorales bacterium]
MASDEEPPVARAGKPRKFVFVCINERPQEHPRPSCIRKGSANIFEAFRETTGQLGLVDVKVVASGCMEPCMVGPTVYVAPDDVWYGGVTLEDVPKICEQHLRDDEPVEFLLIGEEEFELSPLEGRTDLPPGMIPPA